MTKSEKEELQELKKEFSDMKKEYEAVRESMDRLIDQLSGARMDVDKRLATLEEFIGVKMDGFSFKLEELEAQNDALAERFENSTTISNKVEIPEKVVKKAIRKGTKDAVGSSFPSNVKVEEMLHDQQDKMNEISQRLTAMAELVRNM